MLHKARLRERRKEQRALALGVGSLSPLQSRHPKPRPKDSANAPPAAAAAGLARSVRFSEPDVARHSCATTAYGESGGAGTAAYRASSGSDSGGGGGGGGGGSGGNVSGALAFAPVDASPDVKKLLSQEAHRLAQRRRHHHNFKRSASNRNLEGTDGMVGPISPPGRGERGPDGGGGGNHDAAVAPVSVTASVKVYSAGVVDTFSPSMLPGEGAAIAPEDGSILDQATQIEAPLHGDGRTDGGRKGSSNGSVTYGNRSSSSSSGSAEKEFPAKSPGGRARRRTSSGNGDTDDAVPPNEACRDGVEMTGHPPPVAKSDCSAAVVAGPTQEAARAGSAGPLAAAAVTEKSLAEGRRGPKVASYHPQPTGSAVDEMSMGGAGGEASGSLGARCAAGWYTQSKLSAAASGAARLGLTAGRTGRAHRQTTVTGGGGGGGGGSGGGGDTTRVNRAQPAE